jgi:hypothetical protein
MTDLLENDSSYLLFAPPRRSVARRTARLRLTKWGNFCRPRHRSRPSVWTPLEDA